QYISQMQNMVQTLLDKDYAYVTDLGIYFDISKFENYTKLSGQNLEMNQGSAGKGEVGDSQKKNSADFAIWFFKVGAHENALQVWPYTFVVQGQKFTGDGFPGWHLECSAMNYAIFGPTIDIHMGGIEHVPVHHTNEIAQSEAYSGEQFVRYWIHNEHLTVDGKKMSKSEGTVYSLDDIIAKGYDPMVLRYFFMQAHYRSKQNFTWEALEGANSGLKNLRKEVIEYQTIEGYNNSVNKFSAGSKEIDSYLVYKKLFNEALEDDFNIPKAVAIFLSIFKDSGLHPDIITQLILDFDKVLGLDLDKEETIEIPQEVEKIAEERLLAKQNKDFKKSDELREEIKNLGYEIDDTPEGYTLKKI
ncbi:MAG: class I tRNA ligase family protein, partial [Actinomycetota bacterium]